VANDNVTAETIASRQGITVLIVDCALWVKSVIYSYLVAFVKSYYSYPQMLEVQRWWKVIASLYHYFTNGLRICIAC